MAIMSKKGLAPGALGDPVLAGKKGDHPRPRTKLMVAPCRGFGAAARCPRRVIRLQAGPRRWKRRLCASCSAAHQAAAEAKDDANSC